MARRSLVVALVGLAILALGVSGCVTVRARTEAVIDIDAEEALEGDIDALIVTVRGGPSTGELDTTLTEIVSSPAYPVRVTVLPRGEDATRRYEVDVRARGPGGQIVGRQSIRGRFLAGHTTRTELLLEACCAQIAATCSATETCDSCACVPIIEIDPTADAGMPGADGGRDAAISPDAPPDAGPPPCTGAMDCAPMPCSEARCTDGTCSYASLCEGSEVCCQGECADNCDCLGVPRNRPCRAAASACDAPEVCDGTSGVCPPDLPSASDVTCREAVGECDEAERCDGFTYECPSDRFVSLGMGCRGGTCDGAGTCSSGCTPGGTCTVPGDPCVVGTVDCTSGSPRCVGTGTATPPGTVCRPAAGPCDVAETCSGTSCPMDAFRGASTTCRVSAGPCDVAEVCSGTSAACPADAFATTGVCRASVGACDAPESCSGSGAGCPTDVFASGTTCRPSAGLCDVAETCTGTSASCPPDAFAPATTVCGTALNDCQSEPHCSGTANFCALGDPINEGLSCTGDCDAVCRSGSCQPGCSSMWICCYSLGTCVSIHDPPEICPSF